MSRFNRTTKTNNLPTTRRRRTTDTSKFHMTQPQPNTKPNRSGNHKGIGTLTPKQERFIDEYLVDLNATQATIRAGYSKKTAEVIGCIHLRKFKIQQAIQKRREELSAKTQMNTEWVLNGYKKLVDFDLSEVYNDDGTMKPISEMSENARFAAVNFKTFDKKTDKQLKDGSKSVSITKGGELKFHDKKAVFDKIGEHLGLFLDSSNDKFSGNIENRALEIRNAAQALFDSVPLSLPKKEEKKDD